MTSVYNLIRHYQRDIERCSDNETRVLRCLNKLHQLGVTVQHLQDTGVGRTVNALRKESGEVGTAARALVAKWKHMVASAEESSENDDDGHNSGRDSAEDSDHNVNQSRDSGQEYESDHETGEYNVKSYNQSNGNHESMKRHNESEDDNSTKRAKYGGNTSDDCEEKVNENKLIVKQEQTDSDECASNSTSDEESKLTIKEEPKSDSERENRKYEPKLSSNESYGKSNYGGGSSKSDNSDKRKYDSQHRSEKESKSSGKSLNEDQETKKERELRHLSESSSDKKRSEKHSRSHEKPTSSSEKHKSGDKLRKSEDRASKSVCDRDKSLEKTKKSSSKDKHDSTDKHKSSKHKDTDLAINNHHKEKSHEQESERNRKDKSKSHHSSSRDKDKKQEKYDTQKDMVKHGNKENDLIEKSRNGESSSKSKHSDKSSSHSSKNKTEKSSSSDSKNKSSSSLVKEEKRSDKAGTSSDKQKLSSSHKSSNKNKDDVPKKKSKSKIEHLDGDDDGIGCESGASFAEALGMVSPVKAKKKSYKDISSPSNGSNIASTSNEGFALPASLLAPTTKLAPLPPLEISALPEISPNYKPRPPPRLLPQVSEEDALNFVMSNKNQRTKIFSGNKSYGKVLSLYELCVNVLQEHIDALEYTGGVPYEILKPVVDRANPDQLKALEYYNPYLMEDTNHLWKLHCEKKFRNKQRQEMETWREMYMRCDEDQAAKLKSLTANIKMSQDARMAPVKQTKMAYVDNNYVKPPRNIARKQALHGTARAAVTSPAARVAALAGAGVVRAGALPARPSPVSHTSASPSSSAFKPKKAPLMAKALQLMRGRKR